MTEGLKFGHRLLEAKQYAQAVWNVSGERYKTYPKTKVFNQTENFTLAILYLALET